VAANCELDGVPVLVGRMPVGARRRISSDAGVSAGRSTGMVTGIPRRHRLCFDELGYMELDRRDAVGLQSTLDAPGGLLPPDLDQGPDTVIAKAPALCRRMTRTTSDTEALGS